MTLKAVFHISDILAGYHCNATSLPGKFPRLPDGSQPERESAISGTITLYEYMTRIDIREGLTDMFNSVKLLNASEVARPELERQFPWLRNTQHREDELTSPQEIQKWVSSIIETEKVDEWLEVESIPPSGNENHGTFIVHLP